MKILRWIRSKLQNFLAWLGRSTRNKVFFVLALPALFGLSLVVVFVSALLGLSEHISYSKVKDKDKSYQAATEQNVTYLDQGWQDRYRTRYYFTPQGSHILPLDIALGLEMPTTQERIFGENGTVFEKFGYLPYSSELSRKGKTNTLGYNTPLKALKNSEALKRIELPIGFTVDEPKKNPILGINCAACHTSNINNNGKTIRIEGGAAMGDFMGLFDAIDDSLVATLASPEKENRLAERVGIENTPTARKAFRNRLLKTSAQRQAWQRRNSDGIDSNIPHGHGRVDAFGVIFNQVLGRDLRQDRLAPADELIDPLWKDKRQKRKTHDTENEIINIVGKAGIDGNVRIPDAPVSYPVLWDTPFMGRVQWNGSANNVSTGGVLGRNTGQVLGVFGDIDVTEHNNLPGYCSTVERRNLQLFDYWVRALKSPKWEDAAQKGALPPIDEDLKSLGEDIYFGKGAYAGQYNCASCHEVPKDNYDRSGSDKERSCRLKITMVDVDIIKTDPNTAKAGVRGGAFSGKLAGNPYKKPTKAQMGQMVPVQESKITLLREVVAGSIAGSFQPITCDGNIRPRALYESANGFGKILKGRLAAKNKASGIYNDKDIGGGFELNSSNRDDECSTTEIRKLSQHQTADPTQETYDAFAYRARPLTGIWASAPYLHNGSVLTLYDLLLPPPNEAGECVHEKCRPLEFYAGSINYDPINVGFKNESGPNTTLINTTLPGNRNTGHEMSLNLSEQERMALIEYLKTL